MANVIHYRRPQWAIFSLIGIALLLVGVAAGSALSTGGWSPFGSNGVPIYLSGDQRVNQAVNLNAGFSAVAKAVTPAVVTIETSRRVRPRSSPFPFFSDPFRDFFDWSFPNRPGRDDDGPQPRRRNPRRQTPRGSGRLELTGLGSGVIVSPEGYIITNNHVVEGAEKVEVTLLDKRHFTAKVVGMDAPSDIAVLKIDARDLPSAPLGDSNKVEVGDVALAIGNPLGVGQTVTMGIISAKGRSTSAGSGSYEDFLQTDAAINRGNSGGALVNLKGELIGIPSQIVSRTGGSIGIGFAIPTALARNVMDQLVRSGKVRRGKLGVTVGSLTPDLATQFGYKGAHGALVQDIEQGQPADRAGVKPGDIITEYQGQRITDSTQLRNLVAQTAPGTTVKFKVWRDGAEREMTSTLGEMDLTRTERGSRSGGGSGAAGGALAGVNVENLTPDIARQLNLPPATRGVVVDDLDDNSNAAGAGLRSGDVIEEINRQPISSVSDFNAALQKAGKKNVLLRVRRAQQGAFFLVVPAHE
ncbi:MAG: DegQ family serine endoprotease [Blastocatellia bacterium]